jgi:putative ABC transport system substrate-binding protein
MRRRAFIHGVALGLVAAEWPHTARAQSGVRRVGWLGLSSTEAGNLRILRQALHERGWIEGQNVVYDSAYADDKAENLPRLVADLLHRKVEVIATAGTTSIRAAKDATSTVPIVMVGAGDPVGTGLIQSLQRPGGNATGVSLVGQEMAAKTLDLLKQAVPHARIVTLIRAAANTLNRFFLEHMEAAGRKLDLRVVAVDVREPAEFEAVLSRITSDAALMLIDPMFFVHRHRVAELAINRRLPLMTMMRQYAEAGFLLSYGVDYAAIVRMAAAYVDKILRGAKPADLPVEQPSKFDLIVNLKTAKALGLTIPPAILLRADRVIE